MEHKSILDISKCLYTKIKYQERKLHKLINIYIHRDLFFPKFEYKQFISYIISFFKSYTKTKVAQNKKSSTNRNQNDKYLQIKVIKKIYIRLGLAKYTQEILKFAN